MGYFSHKVDPTKIKAGDHIYAWRTAYTYSHHDSSGIYVGTNKVVHFTAPDDSGSGFSWLSGSCFGSIDCGCSQPKSGSSSGSSRLLNCGCSQPKSGSSYSSSLCSCLSSNLNQPVASCLSFPDCGFQQRGSGVILSCLNCFVGTGSSYLYQYGLNKYVYMSKLRGGTCTIAKQTRPKM
uniref:protein LEAD-SENSITIVE 1-like n=1 Tax=Erigeron canadensis TaxID=72917 RepID=UPI001CB9CC45|nr:protein LEAD-SENSITIVE 1-like [Erigeron canadensis]